MNLGNHASEKLEEPRLLRATFGFIHPNGGCIEAVVVMTIEIKTSFLNLNKSTKFYFFAVTFDLSYHECLGGI